MQLKDGSILQNGKYRIIRVLGQGGFGITYLAEHTLLEKKVAIKEFFPKQYCDRDEATSHVTVGTQSNQELIVKLKNRFLKEAKNISKLRHPGIISIHDIFEENNSAYYVMDFIEGESLGDIVKREGAMSEQRALGYIKKVGEALEYIHSRNMTHFDVKPANIMVRKEDDFPILIDFGLSKQYNDSGEATTTGLMGVSRGFSAIELTNLSELVTFSEQSDVYSLGATLLYLLTGTIPPDASALVSGSEDLNIPTFVNASTSKAIEGAMEVNRKKRTANVETFLKNLGESASNPQNTFDESEENSSVVTPDNIEDNSLGCPDPLSTIYNYPVQTTSNSDNQVENAEKTVILGYPSKPTIIENTKADTPIHTEKSDKHESYGSDKWGERQRSVEKSSTNDVGVSGKKIFWGVVAIIGVLLFCVSKCNENSDMQSVSSNQVVEAVIEDSDQISDTVVVVEVHYVRNTPIYRNGEYIGKFTGNLDTPNNPDGDGLLEYPSNDRDHRIKYTGSLSYGQKIQGTLYWEGGHRYTGSFKDDKPWNGTIYYADGTTDTYVNGN